MAQPHNHKQQQQQYNGRSYLVNSPYLALSPRRTPPSAAATHQPHHRVTGQDSNNGGRSAASGGMMRSFVESFMSPFVQCWQPPIDACVGMESASCVDVPVCGTSDSSFRTPPPPPPPPVSTAPSLASTASSSSSRSSHAIVVTPMASADGSGSYSRGYSPLQQQPCERELSNIKKPTPKDVICGRGGNSNKQNLHFRELIAANKAVYTTLTKKQKMLVSRQVVDTIHKAGGRFLAKDASTGLWNDIGMPRSLEKASQALREKSTNLTEAVVVSEESGGIETMSAASGATNHQSTDAKGNKSSKPKTIEAPPLVIPSRLQDLYKPMTAQSGSEPTDQGQSADFVAHFPPMEQAYSHPYGYPYHQRYHDAHSYHPSDRARSMPPPQMGVFPFNHRPQPQLQRQPHSFHHTSNREAMGPVPPVVSPVSWQPHISPYNLQRTNHWDIDYQSDVTLPSDSSVTHSAPEFHQYYESPPPGATNNSTRQQAHSPPLQDNPQGFKRQRTKDEESREEQVHDNEEEDSEQGNVILFDDDNNENAFNIKDTSLEEGSQQLPAEVESKLTLQERVISPSGILQSRSRRTQQSAPDSPTMPTAGISYAGTGTASTADATSRKLNTSAEAEGLAGLAALSTAAFLRLDEGE